MNERRAQLVQSMEWQITELRLRRDDLCHLASSLRKTDLAGSIELMDNAIDRLSAVRRELEGEP